MTVIGRLDDILKDYWEKLTAGGQGIPAESDVDPDALKDIWDNCFLVQITPDGHFQYDYLGKSLIEAYGEDYSNGDEADRLVSASSHHAAHVFSDVVKRRTPLADEGEFVNSRHLLIKYRQYLLPLGNEKKVTHILGGMRWKAY